MKVYKGEIVKFKRGMRVLEKYGYGIVHYTGDFVCVDITPCDENGDRRDNGFYPCRTDTFFHTGNYIDRKD